MLQTQRTHGCFYVFARACNHPLAWYNQHAGIFSPALSWPFLVKSRVKSFNGHFIPSISQIITSAMGGLGLEFLLLSLFYNSLLNLANNLSNKSKRTERLYPRTMG